MNMNAENSKIQLDGMGAWITLLSASMFFFFIFNQMNIMNTIQGEMVKELAFSKGEISTLYSAFFYGNILFIIPAGLILDRVNIKTLLICAFIIALLAISCFAASSSVCIMALSRFVLGLVGAFGFISLVKISSLCFSSKRMGLAVAVFSSWCTIGGVVAQAPAAWLMQRIGWRGTLYSTVVAGAFFIVVQFLTIKLPVLSSATTSLTNQENSSTSAMIARMHQLCSSLKTALCNPQNWLCGIYSSTTNLAIFLLGGVFGVPFLQMAHGYSLLDASMVVSTLLIGLIVGNLLFGKLPEYFGLRKPPMLIGALFNLAMALTILLVRSLPVWQMAVLFTLYGVSNGCQVLSYPVIAESNSSNITATASSLSSMLLVAGGTIAQLYTVLLAWSGNQTWVASDFTRANLLLLFAGFIALFCAMALKETHCRSIVDKLP